jgi:eukaryotic-like serine/threonine-protein kinase
VKVRIIVIGGPGVGRVVTIDGAGAVIVGRATDVQLSVPEDSALSRHHVQLECGAMQVRARDLDSRHGTFINGRRETERPVVSGDQIQVGETVLRVEIGGLVQAMPPTQTALGDTRPPSTGGARCRCGAASSDGPPSGDDVVYLCARCQHTLEVAPVLPAGYEFVRLLGRGAMGSVYLAQTTNGQRHAIKQVLPRTAMSREMRAMFAREASVQASLDHVNIVRVHGMVEPVPGSFNIIMEYVDGSSADSLLKSGRLPEPDLVISIGCQVLDALAYAHSRNIVHRDIKEGNLLLSSDSSVVKVADFGLAKNFHESGASGITRDGAMGGTLPYMSKEQLLDFKYVKPSADIYAVGATLYRLLTGHFPRDYREGENWVRISLEQPIVPLAKRARAAGRDLDPALCAVIDRALEVDVAHRFATALAMRTALAGAA